MAYCLRTMGMLEIEGKRGAGLLYRGAETSGRRYRPR